MLSAIDAVSDWTGKAFSFAVLAATLVVVYEAVMRNVLGRPSAFGFELPIYLAGASYMLSGAYADRHSAHVNVDLLYSRWSPRVQALVDTLTSPVFFIGMVVLIWHGADWAIAAYERGQRAGTSWNPPIWPIRALIPIGAVLLTLQGFARLVRNIRTAVTGEDVRLDTEEAA